MKNLNLGGTERNIFYLILFVFVFVSVVFCSRDFGVQNYSLIENCKEDEYFDIVKLKCVLCPANQTSVKELDPYSCVCKSGFALEYIEGKSVCQRCPKMLVTSDDGRSCVSCSDNKLYNETTRRCEKCTGNNTIQVNQNMNGSSFASNQCIKCSPNYVADANSKHCIPCHSSLYKASKGNCSCSLATHELIQSICVSKSDIASIPDRKSSFTIDYDSGEYESALFRDLYRLSAYECSFSKNITACQLLSNLCVLHHYSYDNELNACGFYKATFGGNLTDLPSYVPWLYYPKNEAANILSRTDLKVQYSFQKLNSLIDSNVNTKLNVTVAQYSLAGKLISFGPMEDLMLLCPNINNKLREGLQFGNAFYYNCKMPIEKLLNNKLTCFYDLFLQYYDGKQSKLYPIPIVNLDLKLDNVKLNLQTKNLWLLTRRMFLIDSVSGKKSQTQNSNTDLPVAIRYAKSIEIIVQLQNQEKPGLIYPPYIKIHYAEVDEHELRKVTFVEFSFKIKYIVNFGKTLNTIAVLLGVMCSLVTFLAIIKTWSWSRRCGKSVIDITTIVHFICVECGVIANTIFFLMFLICCFWVLIFKYQDVVWLFLPDEEHENVIKQYLIASFSLKLVHVCLVVYNQTSIDLFLIDWEQPKSQSTISPYSSGTNCKVNEKKDKALVSIWRTYFIANEWSELQTHRKVNIPFILFIISFYLKVLSYEDIARAYPSNNSLQNSEIVPPFSQISRFALSISVFILCSLLQSLFKIIICERYLENKLQNFVDLCSMANISVLILKHRLYGYYIHGRSVYGEADLDMQGFYEQLKREEEDLCIQRGLEPSSDCQTFQVKINQKFREKYNNILKKSNGDTTSSSHINHKESNSKQLEQCIKSHEKMKSFLTIFLQHAHKGLDFVVKEKYFLENALDVEFQEASKTCIFFRDQCHSFDKVLLYGEEMVFVIFEMMVFTFVDILSLDFVLASFVTYLVHKFTLFVRYECGKKNMVDKTLVDKRFLV